MANLSLNSTLTTPNRDNDEKSLEDLPKARFWQTIDIYRWENSWFEPGLMKTAMAFRSSFPAQDDDIFLASHVKTGTTWLKSLSLCIMQKNHQKHDFDILTTESPHFHVPTIESTIYATKPSQIDLHDASSPRLLHTHLPYAVIPDSIKNSGSKIVYIARNPKDTLISNWHFLNSIMKQNQEPFPLEMAVDCFCSGVYLYGSFFDHVLEYWLESKKRPEKILFLKYEEMKSDPKREVLKIAEFLGKPFENEREVDEVLWRCSLERLKNLEVNKNGSFLFYVPNSSYFRKGVVGDWKNYLTSEMEERINQTSRRKFEAFGLFL
ncbi:hypothetical protein BUALT_Bualt01G0061600 [Buddleja alternifolia]|uniref:Sulfotransferase n=1 Tax=Buddleja alternifolia TaxID=168488 RepID=A0AAV6Y5V6_9LAMI|nr:hypothetical protein BUALT_Bualt01G0061600 [Buddleja alternifolia]